MLDPASRPRPRFVITEFYEHVRRPTSPPNARAPRNSMAPPPPLWRFAERRRPGQAKIRVQNPDPAPRRMVVSNTIVEIVNDDMPFLVDSVTTGRSTPATRVVVHMIHQPDL